MRKGEKDWKKLFRICLTDATFKTWELAAPGYNETVYIFDHMSPGEHDEAGVDPMDTEKRAGGQKVTVVYKCCCNTLVSPRTRSRSP